MKARRMISEGGFGPEDVAFLTEVLEDVWRQSQSRRIQNDLDAARDRERLALIIIGMAPARRTQDPAHFKAQIIEKFDSGT